MKRKKIVPLFILPHLFTSSSIFCGLYAIIQATEGTAAERFYLASVAILFAVLFDSADGRVARMTKTESDFGLQLDSLADVISFGVAPAILVYNWSLASFGLGGMIVAFIYATCGALRLARFNVLAGGAKTPRHFIGLPIPLAAASIVSLVLLHYRTGGVLLGYQPLIVVVMLLLSALMVSNVRYRTFKQIATRRYTAPAVVLLALAVVVAAWQTSFSLIMMVVCAALIAMGPAEELVRFVRRRLLGRTKEAEKEKTS